MPPLAEVMCLSPWMLLMPAPKLPKSEAGGGEEISEGHPQQAPSPPLPGCLHSRHGPQGDSSVSASLMRDVAHVADFQADVLAVYQQRFCSAPSPVPTGDSRAGGLAARGPSEESL